MQGFYNSEDGGQVNVRVRIAETIKFMDTPMYVIYGHDLLSQTQVMGVGIAIVRTSTISPNPLATVTRLYR